jgi:putative hydrolase of the HAD superfamily
MAMFDDVIESSVVGVRKPEPEFYRQALAIVGVDAPEAVFLDDLGINLRPARAMGMTTIKVVDPAAALRDLGAVVGLDLLTPGAHRKLG